MGKPKEAKPAKLFVSLIASEEGILQKGIGDLRQGFGEIDFVSKRLPFNFTDYYSREMGPDLFRHFITFKELISIPLLPAIKLKTNDLEEKFASASGNRRINIDPGYLSLEHVILGTTKGYTHRPYLRDGIYADLALIYQNGAFRPLEWTYPDYRTNEIIEIFNGLRKKYAEDLKRRKGPL